MNTYFRKLLGLVLFFTSTLAVATESRCNQSVKPTGFTQVKDAKAYFHSQPNEQKKLKGFIVAHDFLQVLGSPESAFVCVVYRNYHGYGGRQSFGWIETSALEPVRTKLERKDLFGSWNKLPCSDDSCVISISEEKGKAQVNLASYLHDHPSENYQVGKIQESDGHWVLTNLEGSSMAPDKMEIEFGKTDEPGTITLDGPEGWSGTYNR